MERRSRCMIAFALLVATLVLFGGHAHDHADAQQASQSAAADRHGGSEGGHVDAGAEPADADEKTADASDEDEAEEAEETVAIEVPESVTEIFEKRCVSCHGTSGAAGLSLSTDDLAGEIVGSASVQIDSLALVEPGEPDRSYLLMKVRGEEGIIGRRMPLGGSKLPDESIAILEEWVASLAAGRDAGSAESSAAPGDATEQSGPAAEEEKEHDSGEASGAAEEAPQPAETSGQEGE